MPAETTINVNPAGSTPVAVINDGTGNRQVMQLGTQMAADGVATTFVDETGIGLLGTGGTVNRQKDASNGDGGAATGYPLIVNGLWTGGGVNRQYSASAIADGGGGTIHPATSGLGLNPSNSFDRLRTLAASGYGLGVQQVAATTMIAQQAGAASTLPAAGTTLANFNGASVLGSRLNALWFRWGGDKALTLTVYLQATSAMTNASGLAVTIPAGNVTPQMGWVSPALTGGIYNLSGTSSVNAAAAAFLMSLPMGLLYIQTTVTAGPATVGGYEFAYLGLC